MLTDLGHRPLIVAAVTPLRDGGSQLDEGAIGLYIAFLEAHGADGVFACGTTGEGILLTLDERRRAAAAYRGALSGALIVHAGARRCRSTATPSPPAPAIRCRSGSSGASATRSTTWRASRSASRPTSAWRHTSSSASRCSSGTSRSSRRASPTVRWEPC